MQLSNYIENNFPCRTWYKHSRDHLMNSAINSGMDLWLPHDYDQFMETYLNEKKYQIWIGTKGATSPDKRSWLCNNGIYCMRESTIFEPFGLLFYKREFQEYDIFENLNGLTVIDGNLYWVHPNAELNLRKNKK